jgi:Class III cytochrome C family.
MKNQTSLLRWAGLFALGLVVLVVGGKTSRAAQEGGAAEKRADVIVIDTMAREGKLSLPAVTFLHDQHTKALAAAKMDCSSCHQPPQEGKEGTFVFRFTGTDGKQGEELKNLYHEKCMGCHADLRSVLKKTGPVDPECRTCHNPRPAVESDRQPMGLDKRVHYNHVASKLISNKAEETNCGACHHVFDASARQLVWGKNQEDSCRACHVTDEGRKATLAKDPGASDTNGLLKDRPALGAAVHQSCVNCHFSLNLAGTVPDAKVLPTDCAGCHGQTVKAQLAEAFSKTAVDSVPRLERGQADAVLMLPAPEKAKDVKGMMRPVSFNHKFHESKTMDCRTCHHKKITSCATCHSFEGKAEGNFISYGQVMHKSAARQSCVGCHALETQKPECAGCHIKAAPKMSQASCATCHTTPAGVSAEAAENGSLLALDKEARQALADATVANRVQDSVKLFDEKDIPENVTIGLLANEFEASVMPHRKIVMKLWEKQKDNRLAAAFHSEDGTLCQGCHHNSPASKTPPRCVSCHSMDATSAPDGRLSLKAAYHQQCMTCHARMQQKPAATECADCHKPRGK